MKILKKFLIGTLAFLLITPFFMYFGVKTRLFGSPFTSEMDWIMGLQEESNNFDVVIPGKLYRSGEFDERFLRYIHNKYNINTIICLSHLEDVHKIASDLGIRVRLFEWSQKRLPPVYALKYVIEFIHESEGVLLHCQGGSDRTGYTIALYRIWKQRWKLDQAIDEMEKYHHRPHRKKELHKELEELIKTADHGQT